jgi:hypothetical protein
MPFSFIPTLKFVSIQCLQTDEGLKISRLNDALPGRRYELSFHSGSTYSKTMKISRNGMHVLDEYDLKNKQMHF